MKRFLVAVAIISSACAGDSGPQLPREGVLVADLTTPTLGEGALLVSITGVGLDAGNVTSPGNLIHIQPRDGGIDVAVFGEIKSGPLFEIQVSDIEKASVASALIKQVAASDGTMRSDLTGYSLKFQKED
jgi:hypothetical protein